MIIIIGKTPPPYGGVTIYVSRLIDSLATQREKYLFFPLTIQNVFRSFYLLRKGSIVHLIASHPLIRFYYSVLCKILQKKLIILYTDNYGGFKKKYLNLFNKLSVQLANLPLALNHDSFNKMKHLNANTELISSFLPPIIDNKAIKEFNDSYHLFLLKYNQIFCTNAFDYSIDKNGSELYGILSLIKIFNDLPNYGLMIADPSGSYQDIIRKNNILLGSNILLLSKSKFSFIEVLQASHCFIRATTTDGDALSIKEALYLGKVVICSDCVSRPDGCILYKSEDFEALKNTLLKLRHFSIRSESFSLNSGMEDILNIYKKLG